MRELFGKHFGTFSPHAAGVAIGSLLVLGLMRRIAPRIPAAVVAVGLSALLVKVLGWSTTLVMFDGVHSRPLVETIGTRFGGIPNNLPAPSFPHNWMMALR